MCLYPLHGFVIGKTDTGKQKLKVCSGKINSVSWNGEAWIPHSHTFQGGSYINDYIELPCGQCIQCRINRSKEWANRLMLETLSYPKEDCYFVTLTFSDANLPSRTFYRPDVDQVSTSHSICKRDLQLFFKRLRKNTGQKIKYYACGEYGDTSGRPHYHAIIFGLHLDDLIPIRESFNGDIYYTSPTVLKAWQDKGHVVIGRVSFQSCAYVARYVMKKWKPSKGSEHPYKKLGIEPEFQVQSNGLGKDYFNANYKDIYDFDRIIEPGINCHPCRYFDKLYENIDSVHLEEVKETRKLKAELLQQAKLINTSFTAQEQREAEEYYLKNSVNKLVRPV